MPVTRTTKIMSKIDGEDVLIEHGDATDYQVAAAALAGWRVFYDGRDQNIYGSRIKYRFELRTPDGGYLNRYYYEREAWTAAFEAMKKEEG